MAGSYVEIELDKPRKLRYDYNAVADVEDNMGKGISTILSQQMGFSGIRWLLWAGLKWEDKGLTLQRVGLMIQKYMDNGGAFETLGNKIGEAFVVSGLIKATDAGDETEGN